MIFPIVRLLTHAAWIFQNLFFFVNTNFYVFKASNSHILKKYQAEAQPEWGWRGHSPPGKNLLRFFSGVLYHLNCSKTNGRNSRIHVASCSLTDQGLTWIFAIECETMWLKHATLLAKLPINADNTSWGVAWMKRKGADFLRRSTNSDETFLRGLFAWSIAEPNRNILGQDMINPKRTTQLNVMQQRNVSHITVGIVASGYATPGCDIGSQFWNVQQVAVSAAHKLC